MRGIIFCKEEEEASLTEFLGPAGTDKAVYRPKAHPAGRRHPAGEEG